MRYEEYEEENSYSSDVENAIMIIRLYKVFKKLDNEFTSDEFSKSFKKVFKEDEEVSYDALFAGLVAGTIQEVSENKFSFNGIFFNSDYLS